MIGWTKLEEGSETVIYPPQKKRSRKKYPIWKTGEPNTILQK